MQYVLRNAAKITYFVQTTSPFLWSEISGGKSPFASGLHRGQHSLCRLCVNGEEDVKEILTILLLKPICIHPAHTIDRCPSPKIRLKSRQCGRVSVWCSRGEIVVRFDKRGFFLYNTRYHKQGIVLHWLSRLIATASKVPNIPLHEQVVFGRRPGGCRSLTRRFRFVHFLSNGCIFSTNLRIS